MSNSDSQNASPDFADLLEAQKKHIVELTAELANAKRALMRAEIALSIIEEQFDKGAFYDDYVREALENWNNTRL